MPRRIDYPSRFEFFRRAAFVLVRDHGTQALSRRAVAAVLGLGVNGVRRVLADDADLRGLALDEVERRRTARLWRQPRGLVGPELAVLQLRTLVPDDTSRVPEEMVWLRLAVDACQVPIAPEDSVAALRAEHLIALRGYVDGPMEAATESPDSADDAIGERLAHVDAARAHVVAGALAAIGVDKPAERRRTLALVDGLTFASCLGRTTPADAVATIEHHVTSLAQPAQAATATRPAPR